MRKLLKLILHPKMFFHDALKNRKKRIRAMQKYDGKKKFTLVFGFSPWKDYIREWFPDRHFVFFKKELNDTELKQMEHLLTNTPNAELFVWGFKVDAKILALARDRQVPCIYVEDGFVRSIALGASKALPLSLTLDRKTPYFDARSPSDLEDLLNKYDFQTNHNLIVRSLHLMDVLIKNGVSKYNHAKPIDINKLYGKKTRTRVLVIGQVEDDASILYGCDRVLNNNDVVRIAAEENPDAQIIYKPHPDVMHRHRKELSDPDEVRNLCLVLEQDVPISQAFETIDHVYTITSLAGFEALMRGLKVTTLGCPFYSGWGLTDDRQPNERRQRKLSIEEVFAAAYLLYPQYFDPLNKTTLTPEGAVERLQAMLAAERGENLETVRDIESTII